MLRIWVSSHAGQVHFKLSICGCRCITPIMDWQHLQYVSGMYPVADPIGMSHKGNDGTNGTLRCVFVLPQGYC